MYFRNFFRKRLAGALGARQNRCLDTAPMEEWELRNDAACIIWYVNHYSPTVVVQFYNHLAGQLSMYTYERSVWDKVIKKDRREGCFRARVVRSIAHSFGENRSIGTRHSSCGGVRPTFYVPTTHLCELTI